MHPSFGKQWIFETPSQRHFSSAHGLRFRACLAVPGLVSPAMHFAVGWTNTTPAVCAFLILLFSVIGVVWQCLHEKREWIDTMPNRVPMTDCQSRPWVPTPRFPVMGTAGPVVELRISSLLFRTDNHFENSATSALTVALASP
jgi:hypothetical protein